MLTLLLKILSIIGIVLLFVLIILLLTLLLILFFPIKYNGRGEFVSSKIAFCGRINWFLGFLRASYEYNDTKKHKVLVKILWITIYDSEPRNKKVNSKFKPDSSKKTRKVYDFDEEVSQDITKESKNTKNFDEEDEYAETGSYPKNEFAEKEYDSKAERKWKIILILKEKVSIFFQQIVTVKRDIKWYQKLWKEPRTQEAYKHVKNRIFKLLKSIKPKKFYVKGEYGFESPDTTGYVYGGICMFLPILGENVIITPNFEKEIYMFETYFKGSTTIFVLLINCIFLILDKNLKVVMKRLKGGRKNV